MHEKSINISMKKLRNGDYNIRPFIANKTYNITSYEIEKNFKEVDTESAITWDDIQETFTSLMKKWFQQLGTTEIKMLIPSGLLYKNQINVFKYLYPENEKYFGNILNISSSLYENVVFNQAIDPKLVWYYLDHNFYRDNLRDRESSIITDNNTNSYLTNSGSILLLPRVLFGEGIRKSSFVVTNFNDENEYLNFNIIDDGIGNLIDTSFDSTKFIDEKQNLLYVGFNEKYREYNMFNRKLNYVLDYSNNSNSVNIHNTKQIYYYPGIPTNDTGEETGFSAYFTGSYLEVTNKDLFNFTNEMDFAISFWLNIPISQSVENNTYNPIFNKRITRPIDVYKSAKAIYVLDKNISSEQYPFDIYINNSKSNVPNTISFKQSSGIDTSEVISNEIFSDTWNHILCQKSGSNYEIWVNGILNNSVEKNINDSVQNDSNFFIAGDNNSNNFYGSLDEIRIFGRSLSETEIHNLHNNEFKNGYAYQTNKVGNIFYDSGMIIISDPRPKYKNVFLGKTGNFDYENLNYGFEIGFDTSTTFYEHEVVCKLPKNEFNTSQNPTTLKYYNNDQRIKPFVTGSAFSPYITTIGLYNDNHDLVAIAKFATPLKKRKDIDINVIIRFDI
jgi:hypothetical protein